MKVKLAGKFIPTKPKAYLRTVPLTNRSAKHAVNKTENIYSLFDKFSKKRSSYQRFLNDCKISSNNINTKINQILSRNTIEAQLTATESPGQKYCDEILITSVDPSVQTKIKCNTQRAMSFICNDTNECSIDKGTKKHNDATKMFERTLTLIDQKESEAISTARNSLKITVPSKRRYVYCINEDKSNAFLSLIKDVKENNIIRVESIVKVNPDLINHTDFVFIFDRIGETPLHWASKRGFDEIVDLFLEMGANVYLRNINHKTAKDLAREYDQKSVLKSFYKNELRSCPLIRRRNFFKVLKSVMQIQRFYRKHLRRMSFNPKPVLKFY